MFQVNWGEPFTNELQRFKAAVVDVFLFLFLVHAKRMRMKMHGAVGYSRYINPWPSVRLNDYIYCFSVSFARKVNRFLSSSSQLVSQLTAYLPAEQLISQLTAYPLPA